MPVTNTRKPRKLSTVKAIYGRVREMAYDLGPSAKLPTTRELCEALETNSRTLDTALRELELQNIVLRKHGSGMYVSPKIGCKRIHVILDSRHFQGQGVSPFWGMISGFLINETQNRVLDHNEEYRFHMVTSLSANTSHNAQIIQDMERTDVAAAILFGSDDSINSWLDTNNIPYVSYAAKGRYHVRADETGFINALDVLAARGCRRIGIWSQADKINAAFPDEDIALRGLPFIAAFERLGLNYNADLMIDLWKHEVGESYRALPTEQQQGYQLVRDLFSREDGNKPDGLLIQNDMMTSGALAAFAELGMEPGRDIHIATNANAGSPILFGHEKRLILVEVDPEEIVKTAFQLLEAVMAGEEPDEVAWVPCRIRG